MRQLHIALNGLLRYQIVTLKNKPYPLVAISVPVAVAVFARVDSVYAHLPGGVMIQPADNVQKRGLADPEGPKTDTNSLRLKLTSIPLSACTPPVLVL